MSAMSFLQHLGKFTILFFGIAIFTFLTPFHSAAAPLTPGEARGKRIYDKGTNTSGKPVKAYFGRGSELIELKGEGATCTSCHGYDGLGRPESGIIPTNITWPYLMKSYGHIHPDGLEHSAFTGESLKSYIRDGIYPGGRKGDPAMPVYVIADEDLDDLIAYLKRLDTAIDPGLSDRSIRIGTIIPAEGAAGEIGEAMKRTIQAYFDEINDKGGIFSRKLELFAEKTALPVSQDALRKLIEQKQFFSLIATFTPGSDREISSVAETEAIPLIGPFTLFPVDVVALNRYVFYIHSGLREQMCALVEFAATNVATKSSRIVLLYPARAELIEVVEAVEA